MKKLLITGASGFLGWNTCHLAIEKWQTYGTVFSHPIHIPSVSVICQDLTNYSGLQQLFEDVGPDAVIHTAAASNINFCQLNQLESRKINVETSVNIAGICAERRIPYVFVSTDLVFDGFDAPYRESDPPRPVNVYGEHKALAEEAIRKSYPPATICRMPLMFGPSGPVAKSILQTLIETAEQRRELHLFIDEFRTPISAHTASSGVLLALEKVEGIIHLGGRERISRYDLGKLMVETLNLNPKLVPCSQDDIDLIAPRPPDVSLDSNRAFALGFSPKPLAEELREIALLL
jgi:dTDP-4-dehydrorhamnose reductase